MGEEDQNRFHQKEIRLTLGAFKRNAIYIGLAFVFTVTEENLTLEALNLKKVFTLTYDQKNKNKNALLF